MSLSDEVEFSKAEKAWKPTAKKPTQSHGVEEDEDDDPEQVKTQELYNRLHSILDKLTPQKFQEVMRQVMELKIDTEERLKGAVDLIFEKAISEPNSSVVYANMCRRLIALKVPTSDKPGVFVNFRKLLLNRCQTEFEKDQDDDEIFEKKQKETESAKEEEERERLRVELQESRDQARRRSLGNIKFIGELFKLKMLTEAIMHMCVVKLLKNHDEESLECLCILLSTIGKDLDFEKAKPRMDQYINLMEKIVKERNTSSRVSSMLQDVLDLRKSNWVPRRGDQGPKTIDQIHKEAEMEEHREHIKVQQQLLSKKEAGGGGGGGGGRMGGNMGGPFMPPGRSRSQQGRPKKITSSMFLSNDVQLNEAERPWRPKKKKSTQSHGAEKFKDDRLEEVKTQELLIRLYRILEKLTPQKFQELMRQVMALKINTEERLKGAVHLIFEKAISEPNSSVVYANMCRCLMGLKVPTSDKPECYVNFRKLLLNRCQNEFEKDQDDGETFEKKPKEIEAAKKEEECEHLRVEQQESRDQAHRRSLGNIKFIGELFKLKMLTEAIMHDCVVKLLKNHDEESLECLCMLLSTIGKDLDFEKAKSRMDQYFNQMDKIIKERKTSSKTRLMLQDMLDLRKNDWVPHRVDQDPKTRGDQDPKTIDQIHKGAESPKVAKDEDVNKFVTEKKAFTTGEEMESKEVDKKKVLTGEEISKQLDRLIQDKANNQRIRDWAEANLDEQQTASNEFVRALMTSVCQSAIICTSDNPYRVDARQISQRASLLQRYLLDEQKELQALYALQALMVHMEQPANLLRMFFDALYDEDVIKEEAFYKWETSKDPAEQTGKGVALKSVTAFFTWLREAEEESDQD